MTVRYHRRPLDVTAVQWFPEETFGAFGAKGWEGRRAGYDDVGVTYTLTEVGLSTPRGFVRIVAGDWIVTKAEGLIAIVPDHLFRLHYERHQND